MLDTSPALPDAALAAQMPRRRTALALKLALALIGLVTLVLVVNGAINTWLSYGEAKRAAVLVQQEKAVAAAERISIFISDIESQIGWTTRAEWRRVGIDQQRYDFIRLLRQAPGITELQFIDGTGKEQLKVSRLEPDAAARFGDLSAEPRFAKAVADKIWFGPVYFRRGSEPYMTISVSHAGRDPGVTAAEVNLKLIWDVVNAIHIGEAGYAFIATQAGRLIAHPDMSLVLRDTDLSKLTMVVAANAESDAPATAKALDTQIETGFDGKQVLSAHARIARLAWTVFVTLPASEVLAPVYAALWQTLALLALGLVLASVMGTLLARRVVAPIRQLQSGAERLGAGDLTQRIAIRTGDEIETLADRFNLMAGQIQESHENLEAKVETRTKDLNEALEYQTASSNILRVIASSPTDIQPVLDAVAESAALLCDADDAAVLLKRGGDLTFNAHYGPIPIGLDKWPINRNWTVGRSVVDRVPVHVRDLRGPEGDEFPEGREMSIRMGHRTILSVPLLRDGEAIGGIVMRRREVGAFSDKQIALLQTFADQAVIAINNVRLFEEVQARTKEVTEALEYQTASGNILRVIASSPTDIQPVLDAVAQSACGLCDAQGSAVMLRNGGYLTFSAHHGPIPVDMDEWPINRNWIPGRAVVDRVPVHVLDLRGPEGEEFTYGREQAIRMGITTILSVPLLREGEAIGAILVRRSEVQAFSDKQIALLQTFADQAVIAINNVRLFEEVQAKTKEVTEALEQQTATSDVLKVISRSVFELDIVLQTLIDTAVRLCKGSRGTIFLRKGDELVASAFHSNVPPALRDYLLATPFSVHDEGMMTRALRTGEVVHIPDLTLGRDLVGAEFRARADFGAILWVPLMRDGAAVGVFGVPREKPVAFSDREIELVKSFADQAVIAIENSRLFEEVQAKTKEVTEALEYQTATSDVLNVISRSPNEVQPVLNAIVATARRLCHAENAWIMRLKDGKYHLYARDGASYPGFDVSLAANPLVPDRSSITGRVALEGRTVHVRDVQADAQLTLGRHVVEERAGARLGVPLMRDGVVLGVIVLRRDASIPFTDKEIELVQTFAEQAMIAINNVRLFDEVQARTAELSRSVGELKTLGEVGMAVSSTLDLDEVLKIIVARTVELADVDSGMIYRYSKAARQFRLRHAVGMDEAMLARARGIRIPYESSSMGLAAEKHAPVLMPELAQMPANAMRDMMIEAGHHSGLAIPLLHGDRVLGGIILSNLSDKGFPEQKIALVQTLANQSVLAIQNARLFDEVKARTQELAASLGDLRAAQTRLVQSEKLASLGQLTAGIAHEIKNPLNFVNNFADLSQELVGELEEIIASAGGGLDAKSRAEIDELAAMLKGNLAKVVQHGRRADSIVKNMLLHSREGGSELRSVDMNATVEESLNLAYHGARAEKPGFNITLEKHLDPQAGQAELYPQEFTRVLLNLISNGFYAAHKRKLEGGDPAFQPSLSVSTKALSDMLEIKVRDNGTGIPDSVKEKIFNPFFTTKPAGEGTGLGLSLSHDIIVKQHGGTLDVATEPGSYTEFTIRVPRKAPASDKAQTS